MTRLNVERLDDRVMPAGNVTASLLNGRLLVRGDAADNFIQVVQFDNSGVWVAPLDGNTSINQLANNALFFRNVTDIDIQMGEGNDRLDVSGLRGFSELRIDTGNGVDRISATRLQGDSLVVYGSDLTENGPRTASSVKLSDSSLDQVLISANSNLDELGSNTDIANVTARSVQVYVNSPPTTDLDPTTAVSQVHVSNATISRSLAIMSYASWGHSHITVRDSSIGTLNESSWLQIDVGGGIDRVDVLNTTVFDSVHFSGESDRFGNDAAYFGPPSSRTFSVKNSRFYSSMFISLDDGTDQVSIESSKIGWYDEKSQAGNVYVWFQSGANELSIVDSELEGFLEVHSGSRSNSGVANDTRIAVTGSLAGAMEFNTKSGNFQAEISDGATDHLTVEAASATSSQVAIDRLTLGALKASLGNLGNQLQVTDSVIGSDVDLSLGNGLNRLNMYRVTVGGAPTTATPLFQIQGGSGLDLIELHGVTARQKAVMRLGEQSQNAHPQTLAITNSWFREWLEIEGGSGQDQIKIDQTTIGMGGMDRRLWITTGLGNDDVIVKNSRILGGASIVTDPAINFASTPRLGSRTYANFVGIHNVYVIGELAISTSLGDDGVLVTHSSMNALKVNTKSGHDDVAIAHSAIDSRLDVLLGTGADTIVIHHLDRPMFGPNSNWRIDVGGDTTFFDNVHIRFGPSWSVLTQTSRTKIRWHFDAGVNYMNETDLPGWWML